MSAEAVCPAIIHFDALNDDMASHRCVLAGEGVTAAAATARGDAPAESVEKANISAVRQRRRSLFPS